MRFKGSRTSRAVQPATIRISSDTIRLARTLPSGKITREAPLNSPDASPVFKWAGGKQWLAFAAKSLLPPAWKGRYYEPFMGGGALFFALGPSRATLADCNDDLIDTYRALKNDPGPVIEELKGYPHDRTFFYELRKKRVRHLRTRAARVLYLNRTCWNGLYRVNRDGEFNTPFGKFKNPTICDEYRLRTAATRLKAARLLTDDFARTVARAKRGDLVYFDPPYITGHTNNGFLKYNAKLFSWADQERLARTAIRLSQKGVFVLISNANFRKVIRLYKGFYYYRVRRRSQISSTLASRGPVFEALLSNYPIMRCSSEVIR